MLKNFSAKINKLRRKKDKLFKNEKKLKDKMKPSAYKEKKFKIL